MEKRSSIKLTKKSLQVIDDYKKVSEVATKTQAVNELIALSQRQAIELYDLREEYKHCKKVIQENERLFKQFSEAKTEVETLLKNVETHSHIRRTYDDMTPIELMAIIHNTTTPELKDSLIVIYNKKLNEK